MLEFCPDRWVVGGLASRGAIMNSAVLGIEFCAMHDAIEPGHGPPRMKTFAAVREMEMMCKVAQTASLSAPLVQNDPQDGGHDLLLPCVCEYGRRRHSQPLTRNIKAQEENPEQ